MITCVPWRVRCVVECQLLTSFGIVSTSPLLSNISFTNIDFTNKRMLAWSYFAKTQMSEEFPGTEHELTLRLWSSGDLKLRNLVFVMKCR